MDSRLSARALAAALGGWRSSDPAYEALADAVRLLCLDNRLAAHTALPAERELAAALSVSRTTVAAAYQSLRDSGHIRSVRGSGSVTLPLARRDPGIRPGLEDTIDLQQASRSEEHTSELQSLMRISYAVFCLKKTKAKHTDP